MSLFDTSTLRTDAESLTGAAMAKAWTFLRTHWMLILSLFVLLLVLNEVGSYLFRSSNRLITVYVGAPGSSNYRIRDRLAQAVRGITSIPGVTYRATVVPTGGSHEIENKVKDDTDGRSIGVIADGSHSPDLRTLLPLDWDYVHVLARVGFLDGVRARLDNKWPTDLSEVMPSLRYGRVFAGARESGTLDFATALFDRYKNTPSESINDYLVPGISNWEQAESALKAGEIDLAFYCGPIGATTVQSIADDGTAVLLGLGDVQTALSEDADFALVETLIPKNTYRASQVRRANWLLDLISTAPKLYFCANDIKSLAARRLIVASSSMSTQDAYLISSALAEALAESQDCPANTWKRQKPHEAPALTSANAELGIQPHPGAILVRDNGTLGFWWKPSSWSPFWRTVVFGVISLVATVVVHSVAMRFRAPPQGLPNDTAEKRTRELYEGTKAAIGSALNGLRSDDRPFSRSKRESWRKRLIELQEKVFALRDDVKAEDYNSLNGDIDELWSAYDEATDTAPRAAVPESESAGNK
jgi:TRAP-type uncharacterized transport system substrate-binding protein